MKRKRTAILSVLLSAVLLYGLSACFSSEEKSDGGLKEPETGPEIGNEDLLPDIDEPGESGESDAGDAEGDVTKTRESHDGLVFAIRSTYCGVCGLSEDAGPEIEIPSEFDGYPVTVIDDGAFAGRSDLTAVSIPDTVETVGEHAFDGCSSISSLTIPRGIKTIENYAFSGCTGLECIRLDAVALEDLQSGNRVFYGAGQSACGITFVIGKGASRVPANLFALSSYSGVPKITSVETEKGSVCESIGDGAFMRDLYLTSVTVGENVTSIGYGAFFECRRLLEVCDMSALGIEPGGDGNGGIALYAKNVCHEREHESFLSYEDGYVFYGDGEECLLLGYDGTDTSLSLPEGEGFYGINEYAFYYMTEISSVTVPDSAVLVGEYAFAECSSLEYVFLGSGVESVGDYAFYACLSLTGIEIPDAAKSVESHAFASCSSIESVSLGDGLCEIGDRAFQSCRSLTFISLPEGVTRIESDTFEHCSSLEAVVMGSGLVSVGNYAFSDCPSLETVYFSGTEEDWESVEIGANNEPLTEASVLFFSEVEPEEAGPFWHFGEDVLPEKW
ncbi:MAG: leucine-rich repeat domain-containing protein [Clostridia bacterium]|nr:leucine-rich repeat domain-containing protein [Clostridia bacterium]